MVRSILPPPNDPITGADLPSAKWMTWFRSIFHRLPYSDRYTVDVTPAQVAANTTSEQTFTVTGLRSVDLAVVNKPTYQAGLGIVGARVSADDTLAVTYMNCTGSPITPASETYEVLGVRR